MNGAREREEGGSERRKEGAGGREQPSEGEEQVSEQGRSEGRREQCTLQGRYPEEDTP